MVNFIGVGAQRCGTSWLYACLYEHPQICAPIKEIHFFSRDRYTKGKEWYESHFKECGDGKVKGEYSTSYLYTDGTAERIKESYPLAKIIVVLRNPISRAVSHYGNAIKGGEIPESMSFENFFKREKSVLEQGRYAEQLERYFKLFDRSQTLVLIYEDGVKNPEAYIKKIYEFLGVDTSLVPSMLHTIVNVSRVPRNIVFDRFMHRSSEFLRRIGLDRFVHAIRQIGIPDLIRKFNTKPKKKEKLSFDRAPLVAYFKDDVTELSKMLGRDLNLEWDIHT